MPRILRQAAWEIGRIDPWVCAILCLGAGCCTSSTSSATAFKTFKSSGSTWSTLINETHFFCCFMRESWQDWLLMMFGRKISRCKERKNLQKCHLYSKSCSQRACTAYYLLIHYWVLKHWNTSPSWNFGRHQGPHHFFAAFRRLSGSTFHWLKAHSHATGLRTWRAHHNALGTFKKWGGSMGLDVSEKKSLKFLCWDTSSIHGIYKKVRLHLPIHGLLALLYTHKIAKRRHHLKALGMYQYKPIENQIQPFGTTRSCRKAATRSPGTKPPVQGMCWISEGTTFLTQPTRWAEATEVTNVRFEVQDLGVIALSGWISVS